MSIYARIACYAMRQHNKSILVVDGAQGDANDDLRGGNAA